MRKNMFFRLISILLTLIVAMLSSTSIFAGPDNIADSIFQEMTNSSAPGKYETATRGVYTGGQWEMRSRIVDQNLFTFRAPSAKGGCGGISMFGGSFSFINEDEFVNLLRQAASNARGYAFQLAMDTLCPTCTRLMNDLQNKIQALNEHLRNSCQLGKGLVNSLATISDSVDQATKEHRDGESLQEIAEGTAEDFYEAVSSGQRLMTAVGSVFDAQRTRMGATAYSNEKTGNILWKSLRANNFSTMFNITGADDEYLETVLSMLGSIVVSDNQPANDGTNAPEPTLLPALISLDLQMLVEGDGNNRLTIYDCANTAGLNAGNTIDICRIVPDTTKSVPYTPILSRFQSALFSSGGYLDRLDNGQDLRTALSAYNQNVIASMPNDSGSMLFKLGRVSPQAARDFANRAVFPISLEVTYHLVKDSILLAEKSLGNNSTKDSPAKTFSTQQLTQFAESKAKLEKQYIDLRERYGKLDEIIARYDDVLAHAEKNRFVSADLN